MKVLFSRYRNSLLVGFVAFIVGAVFGLIVFGWWLWPVEWINAVPSVLQQSDQQEYLLMAIDSYSINGDPILARNRFVKLGENRGEMLNTIGAIYKDKAKFQQFQAVVSEYIPTSLPSGNPASATSSSTPTTLPVEAFYLIGLFAVMIVAAGGAVLFLNRRNRRAPLQADASPSIEAEGDLSPEAGSALIAQAAKEPVERFVTTYVLGDDLYEDSFTINSPAGEFLGECGVGISEPIGVGEPKKVTAFEVWLFDRKESRSSTSILMSQYAFQKQDVRASLAPRGNPVHAEEGADFWMETQTLQLRVSIREIQYGKDPLPEKSYFEKIMLQLEVWVK